MELYLYIHEPYIYMSVYVFMYIYIYIYIHIIYIYIYMCVCMCTRMYTHSCIYACIPTRTHMCIFQPMCWSWPSRMRMGWSAGLPAGSDRNPPVFIHRYSTCHQHVLVSTHADVYACIHVYIYTVYDVDVHRQLWSYMYVFCIWPNHVHSPVEKTWRYLPLVTVVFVDVMVSSNSFTHMK